MNYIKNMLLTIALLYQSWLFDRGITKFNKLRNNESKADYIVRTTLNKNKS